MDGVNTYNCQCPPEWTGTILFGFLILILFSVCEKKREDKKCTQVCLCVNVKGDD